MKPLNRWCVYLGDNQFIKSFDNGIDALKFVLRKCYQTSKGTKAYNLRLDGVIVWEEGDDTEYFTKENYTYR